MFCSFVSPAIYPITSVANIPRCSYGSSVCFPNLGVHRINLCACRFVHKIPPSFSFQLICVQFMRELVLNVLHFYFFACAQTEFHYYLNNSIFRSSRTLTPFPCVHCRVIDTRLCWQCLKIKSEFHRRINNIGKVSDSSSMPWRLQCDEQTNVNYFFSSGSTTGIGPETLMKSEKKTTEKWLWVMSVLWRTIDQPTQSQSHQILLTVP